MQDHFELTKDQLEAIKKKLDTPLLPDEAALLGALVVMATTRPDAANKPTAWHYMIPQ